MMTTASCIIAIAAAVFYIVTYDALAAPTEPGVFRVPMRRAMRQSSPNSRRRGLASFTYNSINYQNAMPLITISVGTPPQPILLDVDTGSADIWFASTLCSNCDASQHKFDPTQSTTYKDLKTQANVQYGDGTGANMEKSTDTVTMGDALTLVVTDQIIGLATFYNDTDQNKAQYDGVIGMGWPSDSNLGAMPIVLAMHNEGLISQPMFSMYFSEDLDTQSGAGELIFGGIDQSKVSGDIFYASLSKAGKSSGSWQFSLTGINIGDQALPNGCVTPDFGCQTVPDSGTSAVVGPNDQVYAILQALGATLSNPSDPFNGSNWGWPCSQTSGLASVSFMIGDSALTLLPADYIIPNPNSDNDPTAVCQSTFSFQGFNSTDADTAQISTGWLLGDYFMRKFYMIYDYGQSRMGFGPMAASGASNNNGQSGNPTDAPSYNNGPMENPTDAPNYDDGSMDSATGSPNYDNGQMGNPGAPHHHHGHHGPNYDMGSN